MVLWPKRSASAGIIRDLLTESIELTHEALDKHASKQAAGLVRHMLVDLALLPKRNEQHVAFERWRDEFLQGQPNSVLKYLGPYCRWFVPSRVKLLISRNGVTDATFVRARRWCRTAERFLVYLDEQGGELGAASHALVEDFLALNPSEREPLRLFLRWTIDSGRSRRINRLASQVTLPTTAYPVDEYRAWMHRFANDESIPLRARITGMLCGTLGRPASAVAVLRTADIDDSGENMTIQMGRSPVQLREPLPQLIRRLLAQPRRWDVESDWLFPSKLRAGEHTDFSRFTVEINALGCNVVALRGAALLTLSATMPVGPLADLTGMSTNVATRWQTIAAAAFSAYPALRLEPLEHVVLPPPRVRGGSER